MAEIIIYKFEMKIIYQYFFIISTISREWIYQCSQAKSIKSVEYKQKITFRPYSGRNRIKS